MAVDPRPGCRLRARYRGTSPHGTGLRPGRGARSHAAAGVAALPPGSQPNSTTGCQSMWGHDAGICHSDVETMYKAPPFQESLMK